MLCFSNQKRATQLFASFSINRPEHCSQSSLLPQECLSNPSLIPLCFHLSAARKRRQLQHLGSHLILSNIYESKEILEHMLQSMTKQKKISFLTYHPCYTHPRNYLFAMTWPSARLYKGFLCHMNLFQTSHYLMKPHLERGIFFLLPWALPSESCSACLSLSLALQPASTQLRFLLGAMGGCRFGALLVAEGFNSWRHPRWRSFGATPGDTEPRPGAALGVLGLHLPATH